MARYSLRPPRQLVFWSTGGKVRRQELLGGFKQSRLVVPQDQTVVTTFFIEDLMHRLVLGMHAIELHHPALEVQPLKEGPSGGNFVGLFVYDLNS